MSRSASLLSRVNFQLLVGLSLVASGGILALPGCEITTDGDFGGYGGDDDSSGGKSSSSGGKGSGGKASGGEGGAGAGGASTGGTNSGGSAGSGDQLDCQADGTAQGEFKGIDDPDECTQCLSERCKSSWETCNAAEPSAACRWGSTSFVDGSTTVEGEFDCILTCFKDLGDDFVGDEYDVNQCALQCGSAECNQNSAGPVAISVAECLSGTGDDDIGCQIECDI